MQTDDNILDLRQEQSSHLQAAAYHRLKQLERGRTVTVLTAQDPSLMMQTVNLHLRDNLSWETSQDKDGTWRTRVMPRDDMAPQDIVDVLTRDHKRIDDLFAKSLHLVNGGNVAEAAPLLHLFAEGLRRHIQVENEILTRSFSAPRDPFGGDPTSTMLREHDEILGQAAVIESYFDDGLPDAAEVSAYFAILSGTLAKHEYREESNLFPHWKMALSRAPAEAQQALLKRVLDILSGVEAGGQAGSPR